MEEGGAGARAGRRDPQMTILEAGSCQRASHTHPFNRFVKPREGSEGHGQGVVDCGNTLSGLWGDWAAVYSTSLIFLYISLVFIVTSIIVIPFTRHALYFNYGFRLFFVYYCYSYSPNTSRFAFQLKMSST